MYIAYFSVISLLQNIFEESTLYLSNFGSYKPRPSLCDGLLLALNIEQHLHFTVVANDQ
jgi:hypothetical protein